MSVHAVWPFMRHCVQQSDFFLNLIFGSNTKYSHIVDTLTISSFGDFIPLLNYCKYVNLPITNKTEETMMM